MFGAYFKQFSLSSPDVNKKKGVAETAPLMVMLHGTTFTTIFRATSTSTPKRFANVASFWSPSKKRPTCCTRTRPAVLREKLSLQFLLPCNIMNKLYRWSYELGENQIIVNGQGCFRNTLHNVLSPGMCDVKLGWII